jgi:hypothetical protein
MITGVINMGIRVSPAPLRAPLIANIAEKNHVKPADNQ